MNEQKMREEFEYDAERYGFDITRSGWATSEPWSEYVSLETGHRWAGWLAGCENTQKELAEKPPVEPEEVYSPNTIIVDDKCRKCAGQMRDGKAISQTFTGTPDFSNGEVVTLSPGGSGKMVDCMKCEDCGWSVPK